MDFSRFDWVKWMRLFGRNTPELDDDRYDAQWVEDICLTACELAVTVCPACIPLLRSGELSERMFAYIICQSILRTVRYDAHPFQSEDNSAYSYNRGSAYDASPDLWFSDKEQAILNGVDDGLFGSVPLGVDRIYGR